MTKTFDPTKPVQTRDGRKARIICTDRGDSYSIVALVKSGDGELINTFTSDGQCLWGGVTTDLDLINIPERKETWQNVYPEQNGLICSAKDVADKAGKAARLGCLIRTYEDDELVDIRFEKV